jgi:hypothetical protein
MRIFTQHNRSAAKLAYPEAQAVIDGGNLASENVDPQHSANAIEGDIKVLHVGPCPPSTSISG